jgi:hypothetical protein
VRPVPGDNSALRKRIVLMASPSQTEAVCMVSGCVRIGLP